MNKIKDDAEAFNVSAWGVMPYWSDPYYVTGYTPPPEMTAERINAVLPDTRCAPLSDRRLDQESGFNPSRLAEQLDEKRSKQLGIYNITSLGDDPDAYLADLDKNDLYMYQANSAFFSQTGKKADAVDKRAFQSNMDSNPEGIAVQWARDESDRAIRDTNSILEPNLDDPGHATFEYNIRGDDQLDMVKESVASFLERRDRFLIPPPQGTVRMTPEVLQNMQFRQAMMETDDGI